jgi:hypothetical protein
MCFNICEQHQMGVAEKATKKAIAGPSNQQQQKQQKQKQT